MSRPSIQDIDYHEFLTALRKAVDDGSRIDVSERQRWTEWVKKHRVREAAFKSMGGGRFEGLQPVIIDNDGKWGGYYLHSSEEEACLKWYRPESDGA
jgi:hypothetical protein